MCVFVCVCVGGGGYGSTFGVERILIGAINFTSVSRKQCKLQGSYNTGITGIGSKKLTEFIGNSQEIAKFTQIQVFFIRRLWILQILFRNT